MSISYYLLLVVSTAQNICTFIYNLGSLIVKEIFEIFGLICL